LSPGISGEGDAWRFQSHYSFIKDDLEYLSPTYETRSWTEQEEIESQFEWEWNESLSVTLGASYATQRYLQDGYSAFSTPPTTWREGDGWEKVSGFGLLRYVPSSAFELSGGMRAEDYSDYGSPTTWTLFSRRILTESVSLFGRYSTGFSPPTALELYGIGPYFSGNPNLKPEESEGWELGLLFGNDRSGGEARLTYFDNWLKNLIQRNPAENLSSASAKGVELSFVWFVADAWQLRGSYAYLEALNKQTSEGFLDRRPKHSGSIGLEYSDGSTVVGAETIFRGDTREKDWDWFSLTYDSWISADDYAVARLYAEHEWREGLSLFGRIENLFDEEYEEVDGYPALGIGAFGGLRYSF
jgi:vitamin B12 transporter